jgi:hypothetical protein
MSLTEQDKTRATRAGALAGRVGLPLDACPYRGRGPRARALRFLWVAAYRRERPPAPGTVSYDDDGEGGAGVPG